MRHPGLLLLALSLAACAPSPPPKPDTIAPGDYRYAKALLTFRIAEVFTAIEILRLVEEGRVDLDAPVTTYLPDFSIRSRFPDARPITIRDLLTHRSGLPRNANRPTWYWDPGRHVLRELTGEYTVHPRVQSRLRKADDLGRIEIAIRDRVLFLPVLEAALWPLDETGILIKGGDFDGETITRDPETGVLTRQHAIYRPAR